MSEHEIDREGVSETEPPPEQAPPHSDDDVAQESDVFTGDETASESPHAEGETLAIDIEQAVQEVELTLKFCVGKSTHPLREVAALQPGYVFETNTPIDTPVTIELNGTVLGRGELVSVNDRIGVRIKEYHGA